MVYLLLIISSMLLWLANPVYAATRWVSPSGNGSACTQGTPCPLQTGFSQLVSGDTLIMLGGTYPVVHPEILVSNVTIRVANGAQVTLTGSLNISGLAEQGVTITGEHGSLTFDCGGDTKFDAIAMDSDGTQHHMTFRDLEIRNCTGGFLGSTNDSLFKNLHIHHISLDANLNSYCFLWGNYEDSYKCHAIYIGGARNVFEGLNIHHIEGMGIHYNSDPAADDVIIRNSQFHFCGGNCVGFFRGGSGVRMYNNILRENRHGASFPDSGNMVTTGGITNSEFYNNTLHSAFEAGFRTEASGNVFRNNIITDVGEAFTVLSGSPTFSHNLCSASGTGCAQTGTASNIFANVNGGDLHLKAGSPAIDAGMTLSQVTSDFDKRPRPQGGRFDIGAYEYTGNTPPPLSAPTNLRIAGQ